MIEPQPLTLPASVPGIPGLRQAFEGLLEQANRTLAAIVREMARTESSAILVEGASSADLPTPEALLRGRVALLMRGTGLADQLYACRKNAAEAYEWGLIV